MPKIQWYGPSRGRGSVEDIVSHLDVVQDELDVHARQIARDADRVLDSAPNRTGESQIIIVRPPATDLDRHVYLYDPRGIAASASIEFGYWHATTKGAGYNDARDDVLGDAEGPIMRGQGKNWIPGLRPLRKATQKAVIRGAGKV